MEYLYKNSRGQVTGFEERRIEPFRWISLGGDCDKIPLEAGAFIDRLSDLEHGAPTSPTGVLLEMEWASSPTWYRLSKHWRDWIPVPENPDLRPEWFFQLNASSKMDYTIDNQCTLDVDLAVEMENDLKEIELWVTGICEEPGYGEDSPRPDSFIRGELHRSYASAEDLEWMAAKAKRCVLENIAFLCWWVSCVPTRASWFLRGQREAFLEKGYHTMPKRGVLIDLQRDWKRVNIPALIKNDVPVYYPWTIETERDQRFSRLDPVVLNAYHAFAQADVNSNDIPSWNIRFPQLTSYSRHLEKRGETRVNDPVSGPPDFRFEYWIIDFRGWRRRMITNRKDIRDFDAKFECITVNSSLIRTRIFYRWRVRQSFARPEPTAEEYPSPEEISLGSESQREEEDERDPTDLDEIRELFKGVCAPRQGETIDEVTGRVLTKGKRRLAIQGSQTPPQERTPQERLSGPASSISERGRQVQRVNQKSLAHSSKQHDERTSIMPYRAASAREAPNHYISEWAQKIADRADARKPKVYSLSPSTSSSRYHSQSLPRRSSSNPAPTPPRLTLVDVRSSTEASLHTRVAFVEDLRTWGSQMTEETSVFHLPDEAEWHPELLRFGHLIVRNQTTRVRMRYWAACFPGLEDIRHVLNLAIMRGVRFEIGVKLEHMEYFRPKVISTLDQNTSKQPHEAGFTETKLEYGSGGITLRDTYIAKLGEILRRPNAGALIGLGGPASWIARQYGGDDIIRKFMNGPSLIITWHNKGANDSKDKDAQHLHWDEATSQELAALFGHISTSKLGDDMWFFPTEEVLLEYSKRYSGEWNRATEMLFRRINEELNSDFPRPRTKEEWRGYVRQSDHVPREAHLVKIPNEFFVEAEQRLQEAFGESWHKQRASHIIVPERYLGIADGT